MAGGVGAKSPPAEVTAREEPMPALLPPPNLIAEPGRRHATLEMAREIERRGFAGISVSSSFANMAQCTGLAFATERITFATAIAPIYAQTVEEFAHGAAYIHEISGGRFQFGIGVAHGPSHVRMGVMPGKPLADIRAFVGKFKSYDNIGGLPPVILATLRKRMIALAGEIAEGMVFSGGSRAHMTESLAVLPADKRRDPAFFIGNRIRTCISDDVAEAKAVVRSTMLHYAHLPYYRNYWKEAGEDIRRVFLTDDKIQKTSICTGKKSFTRLPGRAKKTGRGAS